MPGRDSAGGPSDPGGGGCYPSPVLVHPSLLTPRPPRAGEDYDAYLDAHGLLGGGFAFGELVRAGSPRHMRPPPALWPAIVPTLALALELRRRMRVEGASGLVVAAAYRPAGGALDSRHKVNAALDLDLLADEAERLGGVYVRVAAELWRSLPELQIGAGTYAPEGARWSRRVHLDTRWRRRCWQGLPGGGWSQAPAIGVLAGEIEQSTRG